jgi:hypothetical protein
MKKIVWTFGLISGGIIAVLMILTLPFEEKIGDLGLVVGYTTMLLAFLMIYFGIRTYRDNELGGAIRFGRAFQVGILITLISSTCYVATWEILSNTVMTDFVEKYSARMIEKTKQSGATEAQVAAKQAEMAKFAEAYKNPAVSVAYTYLEVFPVGLLVTLVCAGVLSRKKSAGQAALA